MTPWLELDISTQNSLQFDPAEVILANPQQPTTNSTMQIWIPGSGGVWYFDSQDIFNTQWLQNLNETIKVDVTGVFIFYRCAGYQHPNAHIDSHPMNDTLNPVCAGYNWVLEQDPSAKMVWYEPWWNPEDRSQAEAAAKGEIAHPTYHAETVNSGTMYYQETPVEYLKEVASHSLSSDKITVCRTDIPHNVSAGSVDRWCMSLRTYPVLYNSWKDVVKQFK